MGLCTHSHTANFPTLCLYTMKLWIVNVDTKSKLLLKFGSLETVCVDGRSKKLLKLTHYLYSIILTHVLIISMVCHRYCTLVLWRGSYIAKLFWLSLSVCLKEKNTYSILTITYNNI